MVTLTLKIEETEQGVAAFCETKEVNGSEAEEKKLSIFMEALEGAAIAEAKRLHALGRGKSKVTKGLLAKLSPEQAPEALEWE